MHNIFSKLIAKENALYFPDGNVYLDLRHNTGYNTMFDAEAYGFARETVVQAYDDFKYFRFELSKKPELEIACVLPYKHIAPHYLFQLISLCNQLPSTRFAFYVHPETIPLIAEFCNNHIQLKPVNTAQVTTIGATIFLSYGLGTIHFLRIGMPVFVLGPNGLGGLATPENLPFLFHSGFLGRPGGTIAERIAVEMVAHELGIFKDNQDINDLIDANRSIAEALPVRSFSEQCSLENVNGEKLQEAFAAMETRINMIPRLSSNIRLVKSGDIVMMKRVRLNDTICTVDLEDAELLGKMKGANTFESLLKDQAIPEAFWQTINTLLEKRIITIRL